MKKLLTVTCLAGLLSIPSVVFADEAVPEEVMADEAMAEEAMPEEPELSPEMQGHIGDSHSGAVWYGSIRAGVSSSGGEASGYSIGSRWGIRGSSEVSEGLTAVYNFEQGLNARNATQTGGRLSYVGLSSGFGTISAGQIWSASFNSVGAITDNSGAYGDSLTSYRIGNAVSYAMSTGNVSMQIDAVLDGSKKGNNIDQFEFGVSMAVADLGKIAFAHKRVEDWTETKMLNTYTSTSEVMESAVLKSTNTVTGGDVTNLLSVTPVVIDSTGLNVTPVVIDSSDLNVTSVSIDTTNLTVSNIDIEGTVPLTVTGGVTAIDNDVVKATEPADICGDYSDPTNPKYTVVDPGTCTGVNKAFVAKTTRNNATAPDVLKTPPPSLSTITNPVIDTSDAVGSSATVKVGKGDDAKTYTLRIDTEFRTSDGKDKCKADPVDQTCKQQAYYYYLDADGEEVRLPVDGKVGDILPVNTGTVNLLSTSLSATDGDLEGTVIVDGGELEGTVKVDSGGDLEGTVKVDSGGDLEGTLTVSDVDVKTETTVETDSVIETTTTRDSKTIQHGSTSNFIAGQMSIGGITGFLGYTEVKSNATGNSMGTTHAGVNGSIGDSGLTYLAQLRNSDAGTPWLFGVSKSLGGGASINFEYSDSDAAGAKADSALWLKVDF